MFSEAISELLVRRVGELGLFVERLERSRSILGDVEREMQSLEKECSKPLLTGGSGKVCSELQRASSRY